MFEKIYPIKHKILYSIREKNLHIAARRINRYPPKEFTSDIIDYSYFATEIDLENHVCDCYQYWFLNEIINNRFFMFNVFIRKIPHAISLFEEIINSGHFFEYIICQTEKFSPLREVFCPKTYPVADLFTKFLIIPTMWDHLPKLFYKEFNDYAEEENCVKYLFKIRKEFPVKINFDEKIIQFVKRN